MIFILLAVTALLLAYANGANDYLKSFSTLWGSGAMSYRSARHWATMATVAGAIAAVFLAQGLVASFSGRGLVPDNLAGAPAFLVCVAFGAGGTVLIATWSGLPISTTHALIGALVGAGLAAPGHSVTWDKLGSSFLLPLLLSPVLSSVLVWSALQFTRRWAPVGIPGKADKEANDAMCACIDAPVTATAGGTLAMFHATVAIPVVIVGGAADCAVAPDLAGP